MRNVEFLELDRMVEGDRMKSEGEDEDREQSDALRGAQRKTILDGEWLRERMKR